jgi:CHAT domain-containing protein
LFARTVALLAVFGLGACAVGPTPDDARVAAPEVAGHRERLADGRYVLGAERELTVVTEGLRPLRWQSDGGAVTVRHEQPLPGARHQRLRLAPAASTVEAIDAATGSVIARLRLARAEVAPVIAQAEALKKQGEPDAARALLESAGQLTAADAARRSFLLGRLALGRGALDEARELLWRAARESQKAGLASGVVDAATVLAYLEAHRAHAPAAAEAALGFAAPHAAGDAERSAELTYYEALAARERGDLRRMLERVAVVERIAERLDVHPLLEHARGARASALGLLGRHDEALALRKSLLADAARAAPCEQVALHGNAGWAALTLLGQSELARRPQLAAEAEVLLGRAAHAARSCDNPLRVSNAHVNLALLATLRGDLARARSELGRAGEAAASDGYTAPWRLEIEGRLALAESRPDEAAAAFARELSLARAAGDSEGSWRALVGLGRARRAAGALDQAAALFDEAERALDRLAWGVPLGVGRGLLLDDSSQSLAELVEVLLAQGRCSDAHAAARRALSREESLAAASSAALDGPRAAEVEALLGQHRSARDALAREAEGDWSLSDLALSEALALRAERVRASEALLDRALALATSQLLGRPLASESPRPGVLALTFLPHTDGLLAFAESAASCRVSRGGQPSAALLAPFAADLAAAERLELRSAGSLRQHDLHVLEVDGAPLFAHAPVAYAIARPDVPAPEGVERALVIADPTQALPHARSEGALVARALSARGPVTSLEGPAASRGAVLGALEGASFLHFAGHGRLDGGGGLAPRLELADHTALDLGDVLALSRAPRRVVLSACDAGNSTAPGSLARTLGLAQAFVVRGSEQVLAPVRPVADQASAALVAQLYEAYQREPDLVLALRDVQLALADSPDQDWKSFRVWVR